MGKKNGYTKIKFKSPFVFSFNIYLLCNNK